jgi:septum formation inhibitor-activating ATPase MinD
MVVTNPEVSAVRDADRIIGLIEAEEKGPARLILNRLNPALVKRGDMLTADDVLELLAIELIGIVPEDEMWSWARTAGSRWRWMGNHAPARLFTTLPGV